MPHRAVFPGQAVLAIMILSLIAAAPAPAGERAKVRKPRLDLRASPRFSFTPEVAGSSPVRWRSDRRGVLPGLGLWVNLFLTFWLIATIVNLALNGQGEAPAQECRLSRDIRNHRPATGVPLTT